MEYRPPHNAPIPGEMPPAPAEPSFVPPPPPPKRWCLRPVWLLVPLVVGLGICGGLDTTWSEVLGRLNIRDHEAFSRITVLALLLIGSLAAVRALWGR